jgi:hypothetical protein
MSEQMYRGWRDSWPSKAFPFQYSGKGVKIHRSWQDVREDNYRDAQSDAIHKCTAHITLNARQSDLIKDEIKREKSHSPRRPQTGDASASGELTPRSPASARVASGDSTMSSRAGVTLPAIPAPPPRTPRDLVESGRREYLASKRRQPVSVADGDNLGTPGYVPSSRTYGSALASVPQMRDDIGSRYHRKSNGMKDAFRACGVF